MFSIFKIDLSDVYIPSELNNLFGTYVPEIAKIATKEFQQCMMELSKDWNHDFNTEKMIGVLVLQYANDTYSYLGEVSGKLSNNVEWNRLVSFDESIDRYFINRGRTKVTEFGTQRENSDCDSEVASV